MNIKLILIVLILLSSKENIKDINQNFKDLTHDIEENYSYGNLSTGQLFDVLWDDNFTNGYRDISYIDGSVYTESFSDYDFIIKYNEVTYERTNYKRFLYRQNKERFERIIFSADINFPEPVKLDDSAIEKLQKGYDKKILTAYVSPDNKLSYIITENYIIIAEISEGLIVEEKIIFSSFDKTYEEIEIFWINRNEIFPESYIIPFENNNQQPPDFKVSEDFLEYEHKITHSSILSPKKNGGKFAFEKDAYIKFYSQGDLYYIPKLLESGKNQIAAKKINDYIENSSDDYGIEVNYEDPALDSILYVFRNDEKILSFSMIHKSSILKILNFDSEGNVIAPEDIFTVPEEVYSIIITDLIQEYMLEKYNHVKLTDNMNKDKEEPPSYLIRSEYDYSYQDIFKHTYDNLKNEFRSNSICIAKDSLGIDYNMRTALLARQDPLVVTIPFEMIEDIINTDLLY